MASFICPSSDFRYLSGVKGKLPLLESLEFINVDAEPEPEAVTSFEVAPCLRNFCITGELLCKVARPPLEQLNLFGCSNLASTQIAMAVSALSSFLRLHDFRFVFYLDDGTANRSHNIRLAIPPTSSNISRISIGFLDVLTFKSNEYPRFPLVWSQTQFLSLAERSTFSIYLRSLSLSDIHITEPHLLQCLSTLNALETLEISDHERVRGSGVNFILITDTLLRALTWAPEAGSLVPRLNTLCLRSRLQFSDIVHLDFVFPRLAPGRTSQSPFTSEIVPHLRDSRELDPAVHARLRKLQGQKDLVFRLLTPE
ncbi:hypothetical protein C8R44DRAFT_895191 [Mycena epipterygia]|nr:hypothetical protein C8R44DRAFT_895191 [Mycena epipterygia]